MPRSPRPAASPPAHRPPIPSPCSDAYTSRRVPTLASSPRPRCRHRTQSSWHLLAPTSDRPSLKDVKHGSYARYLKRTGQLYKTQAAVRPQSTGVSVAALACLPWSQWHVLPLTLLEQRQEVVAPTHVPPRRLLLATPTGTSCAPLWPPFAPCTSPCTPLRGCTCCRSL